DYYCLSFDSSLTIQLF
nr:immunoglobulin light chain junction region [Macaca mulatta]